MEPHAVLPLNLGVEPVDDVVGSGDRECPLVHLADREAGGQLGQVADVLEEPSVGTAAPDFQTLQLDYSLFTPEWCGAILLFSF